MDLKKILQVIIIFVLAFFSFKYTKDVYRVLNNNRLQVVKQEVAVLTEKKQAILDSIEYKKTDEFVEEFARNELDMIKPNEELFVIVKGEEVLNTKYLDLSDNNKSSNYSLSYSDDNNLNIGDNMQGSNSKRKKRGNFLVNLFFNTNNNINTEEYEILANNEVAKEDFINNINNSNEGNVAGDTDNTTDIDYGSNIDSVKDYDLDNQGEKSEVETIKDTIQVTDSISDSYAEVVQDKSNFSLWLEFLL